MMVMLGALTWCSLCMTTEAFTFQGLNYNILSNSELTVEVGNNSTSSGDIYIPDEVEYNSNTYTVTSIATEAFLYSDIRSVRMPNTLLSIKDSAFSSCENLKEIIVPNSVTSIGNGSFEYCSNLEKIQYGSNVSSIGRDIFTGLYALKTVISLNPVPPTVYTWGTTYTSAVLYVPEASISKYSTAYVWGKFKSIEALGDGPFSSLTSIYISDEMQQLQGDCFQNCVTLTELDLGRGLMVIGDGVFNKCIGLREVTIPNSVASIGESAFSGCSSLHTVTFGSSVENIGADAFNGCNLTELVLSPATKTIGENAFKGNNLKTIALGANVTEIGGYAFNGANNLEGVSITALTPPAAENTTFSYYDCPLYVSPSENDVVKDAYYNFTRCWYRFSGYDLIPITEINIATTPSESLAPGTTFKLDATFAPANASLPYIFWRSTNPNVATVDKEGNVTIVANNGKVEPRSVQTCQIIAESLYPDGPVASVTITGDVLGIDDVKADMKASTERPNDIYNLQGICLKRNATDDDVKALTPGLYIVGGKKLLVK